MFYYSVASMAASQNKISVASFRWLEIDRLLVMME